jgi:integrase
VVEITSQIPNNPETSKARRKWTRQAVVVKWRRRAFTLTFLSLQGSAGSGGDKPKSVSRAQFDFCLFDGAGTKMYSPSPETIVLHRSDFLRLLDFALNNAPLRDYCVIRLPSKCGLRPGEARLLRWSQVDFDSLTLNVEDSKKHEQLPVPIDPLSCDFLRQLRMESTSEWVFTQSRRCSTWKQWSHMPLSYDMLDKIVKRCGRAAGCTSWRKMNMYLLRHFFAANWAYPGDGKVSGNLHALSKILRHKSLAYTQI